MRYIEKLSGHWYRLGGSTTNAAARRSRLHGVLVILMIAGFAIAGGAGSARANDTGKPDTPPPQRPPGSHYAPTHNHYHPGTVYQAKSHITTATTPGVAKKPFTAMKSVDHAKVNPIGGPGPRRLDGGTHALNPQPIPPGHALSLAPHPGAPIEKIVR